MLRRELVSRGAAVASRKAADPLCRGGFSLAPYPCEGLISVKGWKAHPMGYLRAVAETSFCKGKPTGATSKAFNVHEERRLWNSWPGLAPSPPYSCCFPSPGCSLHYEQAAGKGWIGGRCWVPVRPAGPAWALQPRWSQARH